MQRQLVELVRQTSGVPLRVLSLPGAENLALSCIYCNSYKGTNLSGIDPVTGEIVRLFHPRRDRWDEHFTWEAAVFMGRTSLGRATIAVLRINDTTAVALRRRFIRAGAFQLR